MTSILRSPSQIGVREKYLIATRTLDVSSGLVIAGGEQAFTVDSGEYDLIGAVATAADVQAVARNWAKYPITAGWLFRDMGRSITVVDATGRHLALYRNVQLVNGPTTEGVPSDAAYGANIYVRVWAADGTGVAVARLG